MKTIEIGKTLRLPADAVTQTIGVIARKGAGKTYLAGILAEGMLDIQAQVVVMDPVGNWWGLRVLKDGKGAGYDIPVLGGENGDIPIEPEAGALIARLIVEKNISAVVDISGFRKNARKRFVTDFAETFFHLKKKSRTPVHLILEEAQLLAPQKCQKGEERMLGAMEDIVRLGRNYGIGSTLITQRPQSVNKDVLNQVEALFLLQVNGAHERKAIEQWVVEKGVDVRDMVLELPSLPVGEGFIWSPQWLKLFKRIQVGKKKTFDGSATPTFGSKSAEPGKLREADIQEIRSAMMEVVEKAEANDPEKLRREIQRLQLELNKAQKGALTGERADQFRNEGAEMERRRLQKHIEAIKAPCKKLDSLLAKAREIETVIEEILGGLSNIETGEGRIPFTPSLNKQVAVGSLNPCIHAERQSHVENIEIPDLSAGARDMIQVLCQMYPKKLTVTQLSILSGRSRRSSAFLPNLRMIQRYGLAAAMGKDMIATENALGLFGDGETIPTDPKSLVEFWKRRLHPSAGVMLELLLESYPLDVGKNILSERSGVSMTSSAFEGHIRELVKNGLAVKEDFGNIRAAHELFAGG